MRPLGRDRLNNNAQSLTLRLTVHSQMDVPPDGERLRPSLVVRVMGSLRLTNGLLPSGMHRHRTPCWRAVPPAGGSHQS